MDRDLIRFDGCGDPDCMACNGTPPEPPPSEVTAYWRAADWQSWREANAPRANCLATLLETATQKEDNAIASILYGSLFGPPIRCPYCDLDADMLGRSQSCPKCGGPLPEGFREKQMLRAFVHDAEAVKRSSVALGDVERRLGEREAAATLLRDGLKRVDSIGAEPDTAEALKRLMQLITRRLFG